MNCSRAVEVLRGLQTGQLEVVTEEIEELLAAGLAVEADSDDLATLGFLERTVRAFAGTTLDHLGAAATLAATLKETEEDLASDWYRIRTSKAEIQRREEDRITMRRALAYFQEPTYLAVLAKLREATRQVASGAPWAVCQRLGAELYALTHKGARVLRQLSVRLDRYAEASLKAFLAAFEKTDAKMRAFAEEVQYLDQNIGYVRKNREQIVIGLAKMGDAAPKAVGVYYAALQGARNMPDVAVTCSRNAKTFGGPAYVMQRLERAQAALRQAGFPPTPIAMGAAKSLVGFEPPERGVPRFVEIHGRLLKIYGNRELLFKLTARLMSATGTPEELVRRVSQARALLKQMPGQPHTHRAPSGVVAVALAATVRDEAALPALVQRFRAIEHQLVRAGVSTPQFCEADALECVAAPGSPEEVVDVVAALASQIAQGRRTGRADVAVAVSFAKRFSL